MVDNIKSTLVGHMLTLEVDLSKTFGTSSTGKSITVASSRGNAEIPGHPGIFMGVNIYKKK